MVSSDQIIQTLQDQLSQAEDVVGLVLVGSHARESIYRSTKFSDLELFVIVQDERIDDVKERLSEVTHQIDRVLFSYYNQWAGFSTVFEDLFRLELPIVKKSDIEQTFNRPVAQELKILVDKTEGMLETVLRVRPTKMNYVQYIKDTIDDFWYMLICSAQYYKKGEYWSSRSALNIVNSNLILLYESLHDQNILLLERNKRIELFLGDTEKEILKKTNPSYDPDSIRESIITLCDEFIAVTDRVREKYQFEYHFPSGEIAMKIKELLQ